MDKETKEAEVEVTDGKYQFICFSHPCKHLQGDIINENLHCDIDQVLIADGDAYKVEKQKQFFAYRIIGKLISKLDGLVKVGEFILEIDTMKIPKDINDNEYIEFNVLRIDLW